MNRALLTFLPAFFLFGGKALASDVQPDTLQPVYNYYRDTFCSDQLVFIGNSLYSPLQPTGTEILPGAAANGADSIIVVNLLFRQPSEIDFRPVLCEGDTIWINGSPYHSEHWLGDEIIQGGAANGCDSILHIEVEFRPAPYVILEDTLCPDEFRMVNGRRYDRDNRAGLEIIAGGSYLGCDSLVYVELEFRQPWIYIGADQQLVLGDTLCITPLYGTTAVSQTWLPAPPPDCAQPFENTTYILQVTDQDGCELADTLQVFVSRQNRVFAPTVFNPEAAAYENSYFYLSGDAGVVNIQRLVVADRWGNIVFDQTNLEPGNPAAGWDGRSRGKIMESGVYVYWADFERIDGTTFREGGSTTLLR